MAYEQNRGTAATNAISLCNIERFKNKNEQCFQVFIDLKKAFNHTNRSTALVETQKIAGAGKIIHSWFTDRTYEFEGQTNNFVANRGVKPGTLIGVFEFKAFINKDVSLTGLNKDICWCACYSDDRSPIGGASNLINGSFQRALDDSYNFMKSQQCYYHLEGKKRPKMLVFENSKTKLKADVNNIKLGDTKIEISTKEKILGMHMATKSTRPLSKSLIKKHTYVLEPDIGKFQSIANNFYFVKNDFNPTMRKLCIQSYFIGTVNYC